MGEAKKKLSEKIRQGFKGYPVATVALYGPDDKRATKLVVGIVPQCPFWRGRDRWTGEVEC